MYVCIHRGSSTIPLLLWPCAHQVIRTETVENGAMGWWTTESIKPKILSVEASGVVGTANVPTPAQSRLGNKSPTLRSSALQSGFFLQLQVSPVVPD